MNHVLEHAGVAYGPHPAPIYVEVVKKRKADAAEKVAKSLKVSEKKHAWAMKFATVTNKKRSGTVKVVAAPEIRRMETARVTVTQSKGSLKRSSDTDISSAKSTKLSKNNVPHTHEARGPENVYGASGSIAGGGGPSSRTVTGVKKAIVSTKNQIVPGIGALAEISSEGTQESSPHGHALQASVPEV
jgi:hypothetical protein